MHEEKKTCLIIHPFDADRYNCSKWKDYETMSDTYISRIIVNPTSIIDGCRVFNKSYNMIYNRYMIYDLYKYFFHVFECVHAFVLLFTALSYTLLKTIFSNV